MEKRTEPSETAVFSLKTRQKGKKMVTETGFLENGQKRLKPRKRAVLEFIRTTSGPTAKTVAGNFGISLRTAKRIIAFLKASGLITRYGNNRSGGYIVNIDNDSED